MHSGAILFRTAALGNTDEDLRTGIDRAEYRVAFEIDEIDAEAREGWSVLVQGPAHHLDSEAEQSEAIAVGVVPWAGGDREKLVGIMGSAERRSQKSITSGTDT